MAVMLDRKTPQGRVVVKESQVVFTARAGEIGGVIYRDHVIRAIDLEPLFERRHNKVALDAAAARMQPLELLSWQPGFGCHVAHFELAGVAFRFVREGQAQGFFDLEGGICELSQ